MDTGMQALVLEASPLFRGIPREHLQKALEATPHQVLRYERGETIFFQMEAASRVGIVLEGLVQAQKTFPNGSQVNMCQRGPGQLIGPAAVFSEDRRYPCDVVAAESSAVLMLQRGDLLSLMQRDGRILENLMTEIASATYMLQQRLELMSYNGISQKAAFWLLTQARQTGKNEIRIPDSVSKWAMMLNVSRPSLHRELKNLELRGIVSYTPPVILIKDAVKLQEILG